MKKAVDAVITLPVKAIFKAAYFYFMFHKRKVMLTHGQLSRFFLRSRGWFVA